MKKILGIVAVALIVGAPAMAQNASTMTYHLQLNGTPGADATQRYDTSTAVEAGVFAMPTSGPNQHILNWSARVEVGGTIGGLGVGGATNVVFDVALKKDGVLVGGGTTDTDGGFGITTGGEAGFYSVIMNAPGGGALAQQPAAFPWVFNTFADADFDSIDDTPAPPWGRLIDAVPANGPNMAQFTYPSTFKYYRPAGAATANTTTVTAQSGTLMGMGAGYTDFDFTSSNGPERGGIGLAADNGQGCFIDLEGRPVAEGQILMQGLPSGTYTLELTAGTGNNVLLPAVPCGIEPIGSGVAGAFAAAANTVTGSTMTFVYDAGIIVPPAPVLQPGVASVKLHSGVAYGIPCIGETVTTNPGGPTAVTVECRAGGVTQIALPFDVPVTAVDGTLDTEVVVTGGTITTLDNTSVPGMLLVNMTTTTPNGSCITVTLTNIAAAPGGTPMAVTSKSIVALRGDVTGNNSVDIGDVNAVKAASGILLNSTAIAFRRDVTANGAIDIGDVNNVKSLSGNAFVGTCP